MKLLFIISILLNTLYNIFLKYLKYSASNKPLPANVKDVYNEKEYDNWKNYEKEKERLDIIESIFPLVFIIILFSFDLLPKLYYMFNINDYLRYLWVLFILFFISDLCSLPFDYYDTFVIEEKYGLNKSTKKTFFLDIIKEFLLNLILSFVVLSIIKFIYDMFGNKGTILIIIVIVAISLALAMIVMTLLKIFNKFTPIEDGELKNKLLALCDKYNVKVKKIVIKDASKRTTTANAFCTGLGKWKTISLDDNLVKNYSVEEIVAVFAHEFAHARFKHMLKSIPLGILNTVIYIVIIILTFNFKDMYASFGFSEMNYLMAFFFVAIFIWPFSIVFGAITNYISRKHEYEADAFAAKEGYGKDLISSLKKLHKESLSDINPHPIIVMLNYSHPTLSERITAITGVL